MVNEILREIFAFFYKVSRFKNPKALKMKIATQFSKREKALGDASSHPKITEYRLTCL